MLVIKEEYQKPPPCGFMVPCHDAQVMADKEACGDLAVVTLRDPENGYQLHACRKHFNKLNERGLLSWRFTEDGAVEDDSLMAKKG